MNTPVRKLLLQRRYGVPTAFIVLLWTLLCLFIGLVDYNQGRHIRRELSLAEARIAFQKDMAYRRWVSSLGGVYARSDLVQPNPWLKIPRRDVETTDGQDLTLINPAYMTRLVHSTAPILYGHKARLTSTEAINPANQADPWETLALNTISKGPDEYYEEVDTREGSEFRYVGAFRVEPSCLNCHGDAGYKIGDLRGGLSIRFPVDSSWRLEQQEMAKTKMAGLLLIWIIMSVGLVTGAGFYARNDHRHRLQDHLLQVEKLQTKRREDEQAQRLAWISSSIPMGYARIDLQGNFVLWNQKFLEIHGISSPVGLEGRNMREFLSEESAALARAYVADTNNTESIVHPEMNHLRADGTEGVHMASAIPVMENGVRVAIDVFLLDLTEQRKTSKSLEHDEALISAIFEQAPVMLLLLDADNKVLRANRALEQFVGVQDSELVGCNAGVALGCFNLKSGMPQCGSGPECPNCPLRSALRKALVTGASTSMSEARFKVLRAGAAANVVLQFSVQPIILGATRLTLVCLQDLTESRRMESQMLRMQRLDSLGSMASGIAHDLNNILMPVLMGTDYLAEAVPEGMNNDILRLMKNSAQRGSSLVRQLLLFGRGGELHRNIVCVAPIVDEVASIVRETFPRDIHFVYEVQENLPQLNCDPTQIHQVLLNLCVNARDAMPKGGTLSLRTRTVEVQAQDLSQHPGAQTGSHLCFIIKDTGEGIPEAHRDRIFDPFFSTKAAGKGTGLGLSTVIGIVRSHKGFITVDSILQQGSEFTVYIPAADQTVSQDAESLEAKKLQGTGQTILVVDDEEAVSKVLRAGLEHHGYRVFAAADGLEAIEVFKQAKAPIQLLICDMMMPNMDGPSTIECLRDLQPGLPVIAISGVDKAGTGNRKAPPADVLFLEKPFELLDLLHAVHAQLHPNTK